MGEPGAVGAADGRRAHLHGRGQRAELRGVGASLVYLELGSQPVDGRVVDGRQRCLQQSAQPLERLGSGRVGRRLVGRVGGLHRELTESLELQQEGPREGSGWGFGVGGWVIQGSFRARQRLIRADGKASTS